MASTGGTGPGRADGSRPDVSLRALAPGDEDLVRSWMGCGTGSQRWAGRGRTPSPPLVRALLADGVLAQAVAVSRDGEDVALLQAVDADETRGSAELAYLCTGAGPLLAVALDVFVSRVFAASGLERLALPRLVGPGAPVAVWPGTEPVLRLRDQERGDDGTFLDLLVHEIWAPGAPQGRV